MQGSFCSHGIFFTDIYVYGLYSYLACVGLVPSGIPKDMGSLGGVGGSRRAAPMQL